MRRNTQILFLNSLNLLVGAFPTIASRLRSRTLSYWSPKQQYDFVRTNLEYVPQPDWIPFTRRQYQAVAPGGRLILSHYRNLDEPEVDIREAVEQAGLTATGHVAIPGTSIVWVDASEVAA